MFEEMASAESGPSADWLRALWEQSPDGLRLTDLEGRILLVNDSYCRMAGLGRQELIGRPFSCVYPESERAHVMHQYREFVAMGRRRPVVRRKWKTPAGKTLWVEALLRKVENGPQTAVLAVFRDVTASRLLEQKLRRALRAALLAKRRLRALFSSAAIGLGMIGPDGKFEEANTSLCRMLGVTRRKQLLGRAWHELWVCESDREHNPKPNKPRESPCCGPCRPLLKGAAERISIEMKPIWADAESERARFAVVATDLTPLDQLERKSSLAAAEASVLLQEIANLTGEGARVGQDWVAAARNFLALLAQSHGADRACWYLYDFDKGLCIRAAEWAIPGAESPPEAPAQFPLDLFGQWVKQLSSGEWIEIEDTSQVSQPDLRKLFDQRGMKSVLGVPVMEDPHHCTGWIALYGIRAPRRFGPQVAAEVKALAQTVAGINKLQRTRQELEQVREKLTQALEESERHRVAAEEASRAKSSFLAMMSHEIRTPLNGVLGVLSLLENEPLPAVTREHLALARDSATSLLSLLNDLLDLARIDAGAMRIVEQEFSLLELLDQAVASVAQAAGARGLTLLSLVRARVPTSMKADRARLGQVLLNLLGNAVKFTERGSVVLEADLVEATAGHAVCLRVRDTGPGIEPTEIERIFQPFYQSRPQALATGRGAGLGLALSRRLVELMGGRLEVRSKPGHGSEFSITLPVGLTAGADPTPARPLEGRKVFLGDNNQLRRDAISRQLAEWGALVFEDHPRAERCDAALVAVSLAEKFAEAAGRDRNLPPRIGLIAPFGTGSAAEGLARRLGAEIFVEPLRWSRLLPWLQGGAAARTKPGATLPSEFGPSRGNPRAPFVLVADDNAVNRRITAALLEKLGCEVETVADGVEALARIARRPPDLVLLDLEMPGLDGLEVARRVRASQLSGISAPVRIFALTAHVLPEHKQEALAAGMDGFLSKPVSLEQLRLLLEKHLPRSRAGRTALHRESSQTLAR